MFSNDRSFRLTAVLAVGLGLASIASAGPPLICHPFTTGTGTMQVIANGASMQLGPIGVSSGPDGSYCMLNIVS